MPSNLPKLTLGQYRARFSTVENDIARAQRFRAECFALTRSEDCDLFDSHSLHVLIEDARTGDLAGCFRILAVTGAAVKQGYTAQFYDLTKLAQFSGTMLEVGRFCVAKGETGVDVLRLAWAMLARYVDEQSIELLYGCSSFEGMDPVPYADTFALLRQKYLAPVAFAPSEKATQTMPLVTDTTQPFDQKNALQNMPALLRTYLMMGGWVSDHVVLDPDMNTLHVFTGVEVANIPPARQRLLRALYAEQDS